MRYITLALMLCLCGCQDPAPGIPKLPPLFAKGDKVKITEASPAIGIVIEVMGTHNQSGTFFGWKYKVMFADITMDYKEDNLTLIDRMKWSIDSPIPPPDIKPSEAKAPEKK